MKKTKPKKRTLISVILPMGPNEKSGPRGLGRLHNDRDFEIIAAIGPKARKLKWPGATRTVISPWGRAAQQNAGANIAGGDFLWFVHADTEITDAMIIELKKAIKLWPKHLLYFDLKFYDGNPILMRITEIGAAVRSRVFRIPFGDQAFCIQRKIFWEAKGFPEDVKRGEDHIFCWRVIRNSVVPRSVGVSVRTSARKYVERGWIKTTIAHQIITWSQAVPEAIKLLSGRR